MKKLFLFLIVFTSLTFMNSLVVETGSLRDFLYGEDSSFEYDNYISHTSEAVVSQNYNYYASFDPQTTGFGDFIIPNSTQLNIWSQISDFFTQQNWQEVESIIAQNNLPYHVVQFNDTDFDRTYYMLRETLNDDFDANIPSDPDDDVTGSFDYGWGLYIFNPEAENPIIVTVPHPNDDFPSVVIGYHSFVQWDSMFLMISGAGREVKWSNVPPYYNSKSVSDPTRNMNHTFNRSYQKFADHIRDEFGRLEFSAQMHSYDWNDRHYGYANTQISAGATRPNPNLPIWDHSNTGNDLLHWSDEIIFPANTFGVHREVDRNEYYAVFNNVHDLYYNNDENQPINTDVDLWGYSENRQMQYTLSGTNDYDVFDPFFHIEIDELPEVYEQTEANYKWFYGYDATEGRFIKENIYTMTENFYTYWIERIAENLDSFLSLDQDDTVPAMPDNFVAVASNYNNILLAWDPISDYNFKSYEILYATEPIGVDNFQIFDRSNNNLLADQKTNQIKVTGLTPETDYFFKIRAVDYAGNYSQTHDQITANTVQFRVNSLTAKSTDPTILIQWSTSYESNVGFYKIYRRQYGQQDWSLVSENINALNGTSNSYEWNDETAEYGQTYEYKISIYNMAGSTYLYDDVVRVQFSDFITLIASKNDGSLADQVVFGINSAASDSYDSIYDQVKSTSASGDYVLPIFYEQNYSSSTRYLGKNIYGDIDLTNDFKNYVLQVKSNQYNQQLKITLADYNSDRFSKKVWLRESSYNFIDLTQEPLYFTVSNSNFKTFNLYYGNINPNLTIASTPAHKIYHPNDIINFQWSHQNTELLDQYRLDLISDTDSLNIANNVSSDNYVYPWLVPTDTHIEDAKFVITALANDGEERRFVSDWSLGILPSELSYSFNEGWQLVSHVWESDDPQASQLFGDNSLLYEYLPNQTYSPTLFYNFGKGYWVNVNSDIETIQDGQIYTEEVSVDIHQGWNLLGNPYPTPTDLSSLIFTVDGQIFTVGEMISYNYISRGMYVHRDNGWELTDKVHGTEGFYLYSNLGDYNVVTLTYTPCLHHYALETSPTIWSANLLAQANGDLDKVVVGMSDYASDNHDFNLDFIKPPVKPYDGIDIYTVYNDEYEYTYGHQDYKANLAGDEVKEWNFAINAPTTEPVTISFESDDFPTGTLFTVLEYNGNSYQLDLDHSFTFTPEEIGEHYFTLKIANYPLDNHNGEVSPVTAYFNVYPNPFNPETTVAFDLKKHSHVVLEVYNLKGQKVKTICNKDLDAGRKSFVWNGTNSNGNKTASGIYFMRLSVAGEKDVIKKIMLMK